MQNYGRPTIKLGKRKFGGFIRRTGRKGFYNRVRNIAKRTIFKTAEVKYAFDYNRYNWDPLAATGAGNTGGGYRIQDCTPLIPLGNTKYTRIGDKIRYKMLSINLFFSATRTLPGAGSTVSPLMMCRVVLFQGRNIRINGNEPTIDQLVDIEPTDADDEQKYWPRLSHTGLKGQNIRVIRDEQFSLQVNDAVPYPANGYVINYSGTPGMLNFKFRVPIHNNVTFNGNANQDQSLNPQDRYYCLLHAWPLQGATQNINAWAPRGVYNVRTEIYTRLSFIDV